MITHEADESVGCVTVISAKIGTGEPSLNSGLVSCIHFLNNTFGKGMNSISLPAMN